MPGKLLSVFSHKLYVAIHTVSVPVTKGTDSLFLGLGDGSLSRSQRMWQSGEKAVQSTLGMSYFPSEVPNYKILYSYRLQLFPTKGREGGEKGPSLLYSRLGHLLQDTVS